MSMVSPEFYDKDRNSRYRIIVSYLLTEGRPPLVPHYVPHYRDHIEQWFGNLATRVSSK